jgi:hypothetical protein
MQKSNGNLILPWKFSQTSLNVEGESSILFGCDILSSWGLSHYLTKNLGGLGSWNIHRKDEC